MAITMKTKKVKPSKLVVKGRVKAEIINTRTGKVVRRIPWAKNLIPDAALTAMAKQWAGLNTAGNPCKVTYGALGIGNVDIDGTETQMYSELCRKVIATSSRTGQASTWEIYFDAGLGTTASDITQFALFGEDASGSANSGTIMELVEFAIPFDKAGNEAVKVTAEITFGRA